MDIEKVEKKYKDEWVLAKVLAEDNLGQTTRVQVIAHSRNRDDTYTMMKKTKVKKLAHFYTGKIPRKGVLELM